jgi:hypothetical protein
MNRPLPVLKHVANVCMLPLSSLARRSLGDFAFKSPQALISAEPFVSTHNLDPSDRLVLLTSDGATDVLPDEDMLEVGLRAIEQVGGCGHARGGEEEGPPQRLTGL